MSRLQLLDLEGQAFGHHLGAADQEPVGYHLERRFIGPFRERLLWATRPLVGLLARLGVPANALSASQVVGGFVVLGLVPERPRVAFMLFLGLLLIDGLDGALARATGRASRFGAVR